MFTKRHLFIFFLHTFLELRDSSDLIRKFIDNFRKTMPCGIPEWNFPILAPIRADNVEIDITLADNMG